MTYAISSILPPQVLTDVIAQEVGASSYVLSTFGMAPPSIDSESNPNGSRNARNEIHLGHGREGVYHVFNNTRTVGAVTNPGTAAAESSPQNMGRVPFVYPRMHDSISFIAEQMHNLGQIDNPAARDVAGAQMIGMQTKYLGQRGANFRTCLVAGMLRDSLYVATTGSVLYLTFTNVAGSVQISYQMPAGNKSQLNMTDRDGNSIHSGNIIDASWENPSANIPLHIQKIDDAREAQGIGPVRNILVTSTVWNYVVNNDYVQSQAGIANAPFEVFRTAKDSVNGRQTSVKIGRLASVPDVQWHIIDTRLAIGAPGSTTLTKLVPNTAAVFFGDPDDGTYKMYTGSEPIAEYDGGPKSIKTGFASWSVEHANPTVTKLFILDNALPVNHDPYSIAFGTVVF